MNTVTITRNVSADLDTTWAQIADVTAVERWHPAVKTADLLSASATGLGASRRCNFYDGTSVVETVVELRDGESVRLELTEFSMPIKAFEAAISVRPVSDQVTQVTFELDYEMKFGLLGSLMNALVVKGQMSQMINRVLAGLDHHVSTGELIGEDFRAAA